MAIQIASRALVVTEGNIEPGNSTIDSEFVLAL